VQQLTIAAFTLATVGVYVLVRRLALRKPHPLLNVVVLSAFLVGCLLWAADIPYRDYAPARDLMTFLLGPATVGLAVPLYRRRTLLKLYALPIVASVAAGAMSAMLLAGGIARWGGLPREVVMSILPKGVSIPFAVEIAGLYDGIPPLAAAFVVATGTLGALVGASFLSRAGVRDPVARGLALGTVSHAQGTAAALQEGEAQGSMAGLAMILAGVFTAVFAPLGVWLLG